MISLRTLISLVEKKESKSLRRACPISRRSNNSSLPASLRSVRFLGSRCPPRPAAVLPPLGPRPPGFLPSRRAREEWIAGGRERSLQAGPALDQAGHGPVQWVWVGQVWSGSGESREKEGEEKGKKQWVGCFLAFLAVCGVCLLRSALPRRRRQNENTTHAGRILCFALLLGVFVLVEF